MKPRIGVYLSERMATRLTAAAARTGATKSALVEAALDHFLGFDAEVDHPTTVASGIAGLSRQLERLDRDIRIVNETVALHARFHLAVTPPMPAMALPAACAIGSERFEEFAAQVGRRVESGKSLIRETLDRCGTPITDRFTQDLAELQSLSGERPSAESSAREIDQIIDSDLNHAAVREDGGSANFPERRNSDLH